MLGDYRNDTWEGFNWGEESLERLWQEATYDVSLSTKLTTTYKYTRSTQVGLSLCMKCEEKMICSPGSHSRAVRHFEQPDDRAPPLEHDHRRLSQSKCVCSWTQVSWNKSVDPGISFGRKKKVSVLVSINFLCISYTQPAAPTLLGNVTILENNFLPCKIKD